MTRHTDIRVITTNTTTTITSTTTTTNASKNFPKITKTTINGNHKKLPTMFVNYNTTNTTAYLKPTCIIWCPGGLDFNTASFEDP
jgi:hypothetical protein